MGESCPGDKTVQEGKGCGIVNVVAAAAATAAGTGAAGFEKLGTVVRIHGHHSAAALEEADTAVVSVVGATEYTCWKMPGLIGVCRWRRNMQSQDSRQHVLTVLHCAEHCEVVHGLYIGQSKKHQAAQQDST